MLLELLEFKLLGVSGVAPIGTNVPELPELSAKSFAGGFSSNCKEYANAGFEKRRVTVISTNTKPCKNSLFIKTIIVTKNYQKLSNT
jgi:hypothetical protein